MEILPSVELESPLGVEVNAAVIWLHGLGADGNDFVPIVPQLATPDNFGIRYVFPHAPSIAVTINNGLVMPAWYDIKGLDSNRHIEDKEVQQSAQRIHNLIDKEVQRGGIKRAHYCGGVFPRRSRSIRGGTDLP